MVKWIVGAALVVYAALFVVSLFGSTDCDWGRAPGLLRELAIAQEEFRITDADKNGIRDYWRGDAAGLYTLAPEGKPLGFICRSTAQADHWPVVPLPEGHGCITGYCVEGLGFRDERKPDPNRFAYCAWSEAQQWVFIVDHHGIVYARRSAAPWPPTFYPDNPLAEGWVTLERARKIRWTQRTRFWWVRFWNAL